MKKVKLINNYFRAPLARETFGFNRFKSIGGHHVNAPYKHSQKTKTDAGNIYEKEKA